MTCPDKANPFELLQSEGKSGITPLAWSGKRLHLLDQRRLPFEETWISYDTAGDVAQAIRDMVVRGAPAIGIAAAFAMVLSVKKAVSSHQIQGFSFNFEKFEKDAESLRSSRPTAVNLAWAVDRMFRTASGAVGRPVLEILALCECEATAIWMEDIQANLNMGRLGADLIPNEGGVLTHCNAGALATGGYGTALGVIRAAVTQGKKISVFADETRPWLQGSRLTAWELIRDHIPVTLIADSAAAALMAQGEIRAVIVGADRIAANGDVANKIGTYGLACLARAHSIPFYVAAPCSTIDRATASGDLIPIEERDPSEITRCVGLSVAPEGVQARNPVFDVTPAPLISAIITERTVLTAPYETAIPSLFKRP